MAHVKTHHFNAYTKVGNEALTAKISVDAQGIFYCWVPDYLKEAAESAFQCRRFPEKGDKIKVEATTMDDLVEAINKALRTYATPEITQEPVILYNIESHVSFAEDEQGGIFPNAGYPGAEWLRNEKRYGSHHACRASEGGYSLIIGATAMMKVTHRFGEVEKVEYENYYKGGSHLEHENPAQLLNSWTAVWLPDDAKEIPYTDEAALFFHDLMMGMATLAKLIQGQTFDQQSLLKLIEGGRALLPAPEKTKS